MQRPMWKKKLLIQAAALSVCLFEAIGCPQVVGNSIISGTRGYIESGIIANFLAAFNFEEVVSDALPDQP